MRITAELLQQVAEQRSNPLGERELVLRGYGILVLENLAAAPAGIESLDLSHNRLQSLENLPSSSSKSNNRSSQLFSTLSQSITFSLQNLQAGHNQISAIRLKPKQLMKLTMCNLEFNKINDFVAIQKLAYACPNVEFLTLFNNPITMKPHYRLLVIYLFDKSRKEQEQQQVQQQQPLNDCLRILDYQRIRIAERTKAKKWSQSKAGMAVLAQLSSSSGSATADSTVKTFTPGEMMDLNDDEGDDATTTASQKFVLTTAQKQMLKDLLQHADSEAEIVQIQSALSQLANNSKNETDLISDYLTKGLQRYNVDVIQQPPDNNKDSNNDKDDVVKENKSDENKNDNNSSNEEEPDAKRPRV